MLRVATSMSHQRFRIDLAIPKGVWDSLPGNTQDTFIAQISSMKALAANINAGLDNEENTTQAGYHECLHEEGLPCPEETII